MKSLKFHNRQVLLLWVVVVCNLLLPGFHKFRFSLKTPRSWGLEQIPITSADSFSPANWNTISSSLIKKSIFCTKQDKRVQYAYLKVLGKISKKTIFFKVFPLFYFGFFTKLPFCFWILQKYLDSKRISAYSIDRNLFEPFWWMRC